MQQTLEAVMEVNEREESKSQETKNQVVLEKIMEPCAEKRQKPGGGTLVQENTGYGSQMQSEKAATFGFV